jgi:mannan polymerase II complex MNN11 subunit
MNSYTEKDSKVASDDGLYKEGDFIVYFGDCEKHNRNCETEMQPYFARAGHVKGQGSS